MINELNTISVVLGPAHTRAEVPEEATLGSRNLVQRLTGPVEISVDTLRGSLTKLTENLSTLLADLKAVGGFELAEVQVAVELTAEGGVNLIGNLTAGAKGAMQLTFKPTTKSPA
jgi:hypothetical protein